MPLPIDQCFACGAQEELHSCAWPGRVFVVRSYRDLVVGDRVRRFVELQFGPKPPATVLQIDQAGVYLQILLETSRASRRSEGCRRIITVRGPSFVRVERDGVCGNRVCWRHLREVAEGRVYCMSHWRAWETTASPAEAPASVVEQSGLPAEVLTASGAASRLRQREGGGT